VVTISSRHSAGLVALILAAGSVIFGCKSPAKQTVLTSAEKEDFGEVQPIEGADKLKNPQSAMLFQTTLTMRKMVIDGQPASSFPDLKIIEDERKRQLDNTLYENDTGRIVNGKPVSKSNFSSLFQFQVALVYTSFPDVPDGQFCGGSLIDPSWVLTAAHCVRTVQAQDIQIYVGSYDLTNGGRLISVANNGIVKNDGYNASDTYPLNDIALIKLSTPVTDIQPISLMPSSDQSNFFNTNNALISGWGDTVQGSGQGSNQLLFTTVTIEPNSTCNQAYKGIITDDMICAASPNTDSCQGDSGGPLLIFGRDKKLYEEGIVSWGIGCAQSKYPGVYVDIPKYVDWIKAHES
jgi:secreted trypsin-like serine protease